MLRNIVLVCDSSHLSGGAEKVAIMSAIGLRQKGFNVIFFSAKAPIDKSLIDSGVEVICLDQYDILTDPNRLRSIIQGVYNCKALFAFRKLFEKYGIRDTIVHFHGWTKALSPVLFKVTKEYNLRIVITLHEFFTVCPNGGFFNYKESIICQLYPLSINCLLCNCDARNYLQKIWRCLRFAYQRKLLYSNKYVNLISISNLTKNVVYPLLMNHIRKCYFLRNPIELNQKKHVDISRNDAYIFMARLSREKGADLFCQAITDLGLKGYVLGDGYLMSELKSRYPNIHFTGWVQQEEREALIYKAKAFVFPSRWYEGAPLSIIEMKSYGIPCIVPSHCAASEQIVDGFTGFIFEMGSLNSLKKAILKYEESDIVQMQKNIYKSFNSTDYTLENHIDNLIQIYEEIILE